MDNDDDDGFDVNDGVLKHLEVEICGLGFIEIIIIILILIFLAMRIKFINLFKLK